MKIFETTMCQDFNVSVLIFLSGPASDMLMMADSSHRINLSWLQLIQVLEYLCEEQDRQKINNLDV